MSVQLDNERVVQFVVWCVAGVFAFCAVFVSVRLIRQHLNHFSVPIAQSKVGDSSLGEIYNSVLVSC
jgi:hypothetical protein